MTSPSDLRRSGRVARSTEGFSLLEMLVVLAITGLMIGLSAPALRDVSGRRSLERGATEIAAYLRDARVQAVLSGSDTVVSLDLERRLVTASWPKPGLELPEGVTIKVTSAREEMVSAVVPSVRFFADGSATGGHILLQSSDLETRIAVDWLTGRVQRETGTRE